MCMSHHREANFLVVHGDEYDTIANATSGLPAGAARVYDVLLQVNRFYE